MGGKLERKKKTNKEGERKVCHSSKTIAPVALRVDDDSQQDSCFATCVMLDFFTHTTVAEKVEGEANFSVGLTRSRQKIDQAVQVDRVGRKERGALNKKNKRK
jgi:hypothetical protein